MGFIEFSFLLISAIAITFLLLALGEKMIRKLSSKTIGPVVQLLGSLCFAYSILLVLVYLLPLNLEMKYFLLAGMIIVLNKYWFGHFSQSTEEMKAFSCDGERFVGKNLVPDKE